MLGKMISFFYPSHANVICCFVSASLGKALAAVLLISRTVVRDPITCFCHHIYIRWEIFILHPMGMCFSIVHRRHDRFLLNHSLRYFGRSMEDIIWSDQEAYSSHLYFLQVSPTDLSFFPLLTISSIDWGLPDIRHQYILSILLACESRPEPVYATMMFCVRLVVCHPYRDIYYVKPSQQYPSGSQLI